MSFEDELESLEVEAFRKLSTVHRRELTRELTLRSGSTGAHETEATEAISAAIDFREHRRADALGWAQGFASRFLLEIRQQICGHSHQNLENLAGITPRTAASAVAAWIVATFGVTSPVAFAMATLVVLVLARALKTAFCTMSDVEISQAIHSHS
jgi:hypothetical protein